MTSRDKAVQLAEDAVRKLNKRRGIEARFEGEEGAFHIVLSVSGKTSLKAAVNAVSWLMGPKCPLVGIGKRLVFQTRLFKKDNPGRDFRFVIN